MATLPQLIEEDVQCLDAVLRELLEKTDASTALIIDKGGFLISGHGDSRQFDLTTIAALASGAYLANQTIADLVQEPGFNSVYQQGEKHSVFVSSVDEYCLLLVIFSSWISVGVVKYFAHPAARQIAAQMAVAQQREPDAGLDLSVLNCADTAGLFKKK
jgi:predicted regulator of Ras-like GTPase activity (Roadblock/LC7/MglB family)